MSEHPLDALGQWVDAVDEDCGDPDCADCTPGRAYLAALRAVEQLEQAAREIAAFDYLLGAEDADEYALEMRDVARAALALFDRKEQTP